MSQHIERDLQLLRRLLALHPGAWRGGSRAARLPAKLRRCLNEADAPTLERLLIETAQRLSTPAPTPVPRLSRANLHKAIQAELRLMQLSAGPRGADRSP